MDKISLNRGVYLNMDLTKFSLSDISLSEGTQMVNSSYNNSYYHNNSVVPKGNWRCINTAEFNILTCTNNLDSYYNTVSLIALEDSLRYRIADINLSQIDLSKEYGSQDIQKLISDIYDEVDQYNTAQYKAFNAIAINKPNLPTVTFDKENSAYLGLHIDSFDNAALIGRDFSSNRICINVSDEDRFFLFINHTLTSIIKKIKAKNSTLIDGINDFDLRQLPYLFSTLHPNYPVVRLRCPPGTGYIAPTENIIHDGSSEGQKSKDVSLSVRGFFSATPDKILNDSGAGDLDLLAVHSLLDQQSCETLHEIIKKNNPSGLSPKKITFLQDIRWHHLLTKQLQAFFDHSEFSCQIIISDEIQLCNYKKGEYKNLGQDPVIELNNNISARHRLLISLNENLSGGEIVFPNISVQMNLKYGEGLIYSKTHLYKITPILQGIKSILQTDIALISKSVSI